MEGNGHDHWIKRILTTILTANNINSSLVSHCNHIMFPSLRMASYPTVKSSCPFPFQIILPYCPNCSMPLLPPSHFCLAPIYDIFPALLVRRPLLYVSSFFCKFHYSARNADLTNAKYSTRYWLKYAHYLTAVGNIIKNATREPRFANHDAHL
uniref:Uncharacterized protein n=1 Tax=Parascaris univalens TaxID=6257 RepID=A0A915AV13_PARUN